MHTPRQGAVGVTGADRFVDGWFGDILRAHRGAEDVLGPHPPGDRGPVRVPGDRQVDPDTGREVAFPSAPRHRVPFPLEEPIAGVGGVAADVQVRGALASAVHDVVEQRVIAAAHVDGLEDRDGHRVLDHPARIARCELDVGNDFV